MARGFFWIGTEARAGAGSMPCGQMYVEWETPREVTQPCPVVLVHGGGGQGLDYLGTPDGRPGWASMLVDEGFPVYVVDRPGHGRSPHHPDVMGAMGPMMTAEGFLDIFAPAAAANEHTQWPGGRTPDDEIVRQLTAGLGPMLADPAAMHALEQARLAELLDRIGPAIVFCHSAGGPAGYLAADARPGLVRALVAIETLGPPFLERPGLSLDWGLAAAPLTFDPPAAEPGELRLVTDDSGPIPLVLQEEPARKLVNLARLPIAVVTAETSPFIHFDGHLLAFLRQAGCAADRIRPAEHGVRGNGHGMMFEKNNREVLRVILDWLAGKVG
ncbi:alpha/beta fold hydrolase [Amycolatopsis acidicola]|uniref:Alpha/beta fold hydrolase n=1 Tax=Amycolatopsis acidicola TaxID=2596893 RepID=A0A5N0V373_9PSEU|nr:alpha/beta fold hydrolase [Amycolatopsis acidicola]KAA9160889.1 alpha/beta fold hydrolase [Amycolatopsis acidicola]